ncbi:3D (Asp-Asp-Asp) domain-containing protein [Paucidesulfovibrio gracilis DSM 16080]|uniref:3D (Asp-Asp-Asp) domain-containing protein n=1 Tax=Paucidesulfovibrio gracilis DSM 16080 TaxID=1121449 RepID=A0A1T4Y8C3_9BACT|nr:3D domain-containing protein [Paucidesulfovibrio gracilis]SKA97758.1 3D (Asp-Asp-Asp) domain-containing protein [Paucidesulfovibrio gracilis DSM 16080]
MNIAIKFICIPLLVAGVVLQAVRLEAKDQRIDTLERDLRMAEYQVETATRTLAVTQALQKRLLEGKRVKTVTVTAYNPHEDQCDADPLVAASMRKVRTGTIAVSRDLFDQGWVFGKKVRIEGLGIFEINDLMNKRFSRSVDVFMWDESQALSFGRRQARAALLDI